MTRPAELLRNVLIVGGGTAGWMTAAVLSRVLGPAQVATTLIESAAVGTVGVGEATVPTMVRFVRSLGIDEPAFMRACHATYKLGIKFVDWVDGDESVWHPFGPIGGTIDGLAVFHHWLRCRSEGADALALHDYSLQALLGDAAKSPRSATAGSIVTDSGAYAYHVDAGALAGFLRDYATQRGVRHVVDDVTAVRLRDDGAIGSIETRRSGVLGGDLFVDCTGFAALLAEKALGDRWIDWSDTLLCDRAVVQPLGSDAEKRPYTQATARSAGWIWRIPLSHRVGCGYVYSSRFIADAAAAAELMAWTGTPAATATPRLLKMKVGRRAAFWSRNCVAIGLSAGFVEPLESTGMFLIQRGIDLLLELFPDRAGDARLVDRYNAKMAASFDEVRDFIVMHYVLSRRADTAFWRASRSVALSAGLEETLALYDATGLVDYEHNSLFAEASFHAIAAGFGRLPRRTLPLATLSDRSRVVEVLGKIRAQNERLAASLPSHADYLRRLHARAGQNTP